MILKYDKTTGKTINILFDEFNNLSKIVEVRAAWDDWTSISGGRGSTLLGSVSGVDLSKTKTICADFTTSGRLKISVNGVQIMDIAQT